MKKTSILKVKRVTSGILALVMTASLTSVMPAAADTPAEPVARIYSGDGYEVRYDIIGGWADSRNVQVTLTNTGDEPLQNWALKYDVQGEIVNIWNGTIAVSGDEWSIIKNTGYNYEIQAGSSASFGYIVQGSDIDIPASIELCSKRVESDAADYSVSLAVDSEWDTGFTGNVKIENTGDAPLEAWRLSFDTNFDLEDVWNASFISSEGNHYTVSNSYATASIAAGETVTFGIRGTKKAGKSPELSNFTMTEISISADFTDNTKPDDSSSESDSSSEADSSSETDSSSEADSSSVTDSTPNESSSSETDSKPDDSKPDDETGDISVVAYGAYNADESAIDIEWYTETEGNYEVLESPDNETYTSVIEESDFTSYRYHINEDFDTKYFKVKVTSGKKSAESIPFVVKKTDDGYSVDLIDTDSDGLADLYEDILGTDKTKPDTDDDGLTDYQEIYLTGTDPLVYDSVTSGISDAEADSDNDGLSNIKEIEIGTEPLNADTDDDGLEDGREISIYKTDPLKEDTDEDGLSDGDEPRIGLDPSNPKTFNVPDAEYVTEQTIPADSKVFKEINQDDNPYVMSMSIMAAGLADNCAEVSISGYSNAVENDATFGAIANISYKNPCKVDECVLNFKVKDEYVDNTENPYSEYTDELNGIKRFQAFTMNEETNILEPVKTEYDVSTNTVKCNIDKFGTYFLIDMPRWLGSIGYDITKVVKEKSKSTTLSRDDFSILMFEDHEYGIISGKHYTWSEARDICKELGGHLVTITKRTEQKAVEDLLRKYGRVDSYWIGGYCYSSISDWIWTTGEDFDYTNWGDGQPDANDERYIGITRKSHFWGNFGQWNNFTYNDYVVDGFIIEWDSIQTYNLLIGNNLKKMVVLDGQLTADSNIDTDSDGFTDWKEIDSESYYLKRKGRFPKFYTAKEFMYSFSREFRMSIFSGFSGLTDYLESLYVVPFKSDPTIKDSDDDGFKDSFDPHPLVSDVKKVEIQKSEFINIVYSDTQYKDSKFSWERGFISYGSAQEWYRNYCLDDIEYSYAAKEGCGVIAISDLIVYLSFFDSLGYKEMVESGLYDEDNSRFRYIKYMEYLKEMYNSYPVYPIAGNIDCVFPNINPVSYIINTYRNIKSGFINYFLGNNYKISLSYYLNSRIQDNSYLLYWNMNKDTKKAISNIKTMIENNIPVVVSYDTSFNPKGDVLHFYKSFSFNDDEDKDPSFSPDSHYFIVTGIIEINPEVPKENIPSYNLLQVASNGGKYYVDYNQYLDNLSLTSSYLQVYKK